MDFLDDDSFASRFGDEVKTIKTLMSYGCLRSEMDCPGCWRKMKLVKKKSKMVFRCGKERCGRREVSCRFGSVFYDSKLSCKKIMRIARTWLQGETREAAKLSTKVNKESVTTWCRYFSEIVAGALKQNVGKIGGSGIIVEVD